jgi:hypothetical protein
VQWVVLPAIPAAWLLFGLLLCAATALTKNILQPPLYAHRPIPIFSFEFLRWWLVQRQIAITNLLFADQLRGTAYLAWWFRALVTAQTLTLSSLSECDMFHRALCIRGAVGTCRIAVPYLAWWFRAPVQPPLLAYLLQ